MTLWTKRHTIPATFHPYTLARSTVLDGKIWTLCDNRDENDECNRTRLYVFDPVPELFNKINCIYPADWPDELLSFIADGRDLYIWRQPDTWKRAYRDLYKLNRATLAWEFIMSYSTEASHTGWEPMVVIEQMMYILEVDFLSSHWLITIDLSKKEIIQRQYLEFLRHSRNKCLSTNNNNLYLMECNNGIRTVSELVNGQIAQEDYNYDDREYREDVHCADSNEFVLLEFGDQTIELRKFDFESLEWNTWKGNNCAILTRHSRIKSVMKVNESLYILKPTNVDGGVQCEFYELDLQPTLQSICLEDLAARLSQVKDEQKEKEVKRKLPNQLRPQFEKLLEWKNEANKRSN